MAQAKAARKAAKDAAEAEGGDGSRKVRTRASVPGLFWWRLSALVNWRPYGLCTPPSWLSCTVQWQFDITVGISTFCSFFDRAQPSLAEGLCLCSR